MKLPDRRGKWPSRFHAVQFYLNEDFLIRSVSSFIRDGLNNNGTVIAIATEAHCTKLKESAQHLDKGKLILADAEDLLSQFMRRGRPDKTRFRRGFGEIHKQVTPGRRVFVFGEMVAILCSQGLHRAAIRLEQLGGVLSTDYDVSILCAYPSSLFEPDKMDFISEIHQTHTHLRVARSMTPLS